MLNAYSDLPFVLVVEPYIQYGCSVFYQDQNLEDLWSNYAWALWLYEAYLEWK